MKSFFTLCVISFLVQSSALQAQTVRYVMPVASGSGNGSSWANASANLKTMINNSAPGDFVWVAAGEYRPLPTESFNMKEGVIIYGGFNGTETAASQRNWTANETVLRGRGAAVIRNTNLTNAAVLDGFTIFDGNTSGGFEGGMSNFNASPTISSCTFRNNRGIVRGGGMNNDGSSPIVTDCIFNQNTSHDGGGVSNINGSNGTFIRCSFTTNFAENSGPGMFNLNAAPTITNCNFTGNNGGSFTSRGGGMFNDGAQPQVTNCTFSANVVLNAGGGMFNINSSPVVTSSSFTQNVVLGATSPNDYSGGGVYSSAGSPVFTGCTFTGNTVGQSLQLTAGGGMYCTGTGTIARNCTFSGNTADNGGGVHLATNDNSIFTSCLITGNNARALGGGVRISGALSPLFNGCTIAGNNAPSGGGGIFISGSTTAVTNCIIYSNSNSISGGTPNVQYSIVDGGFPGTGNINGDPLFKNAPSFTTAPFTNGDYHIKFCSPGFNTGSNPLVNAGNLTDIAGNPRIGNVTVDMGAYEYYNTITPAAGNVLYVDQNNTGAANHNGSSWADALTDLTEALRYAKENEHLWSDWTPLQIRVSIGTYKPGCGNDRSNSFVIGKNVAVYGGFDPANGITTLGDIRISGAGGTILSGDIGVPGNNTDNCYHVVSAIGALGMGTRLDNVTITGGNASGPGNNFFGGGIYDENSWLFIESCIVTGNTGHFGGGMFTAATSIPTVSNCSFTGNSALSYGGAIYNQAVDPLYENSDFSNNTTINGTGGGGAIFNNGTDLYVDNCRFTTNTGDNGGAVWNYTTGSAEFTRCTFSGNNAQFGGAMMNQWTTIVERCSFSGNTAFSYGGAVYNSTPSTEYTNCVFSGNAAIHPSGGGGAMFNNGSSPIVKHCTFRGNTAGFGGAIHNWTGGFSTVFNSVIWGNSSGVYNESAGGSTMTKSLIQGGHAGTGNINVDPLFVNAALPAGADGIFGTTDDGLQLQPCSPAINMGQTDIADDIQEDITRQPRVKLNAVDMGAYEANNTTSPNATALVATGATANAWQLQNGTTYYGVNCNTLVASITGDGSLQAVRGPVTIQTWIQSVQPSNFVRRHYEIASAFTPMGKANVTLYFTQAEFDAFNTLNTVKLPQGPADAAGKVNLLIEKRAGPSLDNSGLPGTYTNSRMTINPNDANIVWNATATRWEVTFSVTGFSGFFVKTSSVPLPLRLVSFTATENNCVTTLQWITKDEVNVSHFEAEQSADGIIFSTFQTIAAKNTGNENKYSITVPVMNKNMFYRLKITDVDGKITYSAIRVITSNCSSKVMVYPNPAKDKLFTRNAPAGSHYTVYDNTGKMVSSGRINNSIQEIYVAGLVPGLYYIIITGDKGINDKLRFVKE